MVFLYATSLQIQSISFKLFDFDYTIECSENASMQAKRME